jgi:hypothetical protein
MSLSGGLLKPSFGLGIVLLDPLALEIQDPEFVLGPRVILSGGFVKPGLGLGIVLLDPLALDI